MNHNEHLALSSEIKQLESVLSNIPQSNVIERISFEERLANAKNILTNLPIPRLGKHARLTFRGTPVFGTHGIAADFAAKASFSFTEAVAAVAAGLSDNLRYMGPIPDKQKNQLLITGTAIGSFGFEFELPASNSDDQQAMFSEPNTAELALEKVQQLLDFSATGTDDQVAELVDEIHPRAVRKVYDFLESLLQEDAWCGLEFKDEQFKYTDIQQLQTSVNRLKEDNIHESLGEFSGEFQGILPSSRNFEFKCIGGGEVIRGKIGADINDADILNRDYLHKPVTASLNVVQVGQGRPRYTLTNIDAITENRN